MGFNWSDCFDSNCKESQTFLVGRIAELEREFRRAVGLIDGDICQICNGSGNLTSRHSLSCDVPRWRKLLRKK